MNANEYLRAYEYDSPLTRWATFLKTYHHSLAG